MQTHTITAIIIDEHTLLSYSEFQQATSADEAFIVELIEHAFIAPQGSSPNEWRFDAECLRRTKLALRFYRDLEVNVAGIALIVELMAELEQVRRELSLHQPHEDN